MNDLEPIKRKIYEIRGQRVMLDFDLADAYGVDTAQLKRQVRRNMERFEDDDFMFVVTREELSRCQIGTLNIKRGQNIKYLPFAFTQLGVAMLSSVLTSPIAIRMNAIMIENTNYNGASIFNAWASEPLIIDLPLLGYVLYVDLVHFSVERIGNNTLCDMLGYFYYKPYSIGKDSKLLSFEKNRRQAYYNSSQHFLRSAYENRLEENGYILAMADKVIRLDMIKYKPIDIERYSDNIGDNMMQIFGLKDKRLKILYYHKYDGTPLNLKENKTTLYPFSESGIAFIKDTCVFYKDGIVIDNNIRFMGDISRKRVGACLPDDYDID